MLSGIAYDNRREAFLRSAPVGLIVWNLFVFVDFYAAFVERPGTSLLWLTGWRAVGSLLIASAMLVGRRPAKPGSEDSPPELLFYLGASACLAIMATGHGALTSSYVHGMTLILMFHTATIPTSWRQELVLLLGIAWSYPAVLALAALVSTTVARQWQTPGVVATFVMDFLFVMGAAGMGAALSHFLWTARRQVVEARKLGRYRLKARLGTGGMGEVWLAWDDALQRDLALKMLGDRTARTGEAIARFEREARAASRLRHPHTIHIFDFGASDDGVTFMAMEFLDGASLADVVEATGPMPAARVVHLARQACGALAEAHGAGIVHCDIKPANLFVTRVGDERDFVKLLDFGIASLHRGTEDRTQTIDRVVRGTPHFMAPEVGEGQAPTTSSDLYSLGATMYWLLTGSTPFSGSTDIAVLVAHLSQPVEPPSSRLKTAVPGDVEAVVLRCLAKRPEERFASASALDDALARCAAAGAWTPAQAAAAWTAFAQRRKGDGSNFT